ncbi:DUF2490 domain-containing protein [Nitrosomonas sp.]|uniref:DUF2490 domain-containing protein n=1 Tax=Nitrosomonas sp. TaxID=42353 RepID=UPI0025D26015|nr:DUF2490 domain-containing protein [Nitrosomonas sp.]MBS0588296.1 DUF2490 domain-containing protein [Pseudomonadota bacterium]MBV6446525.1 hypothetical protein [Nitrosomonas sp.]
MFKKINKLVLLAAAGLMLSNPVAAEKVETDHEVWGALFMQGNFGFIDNKNPELKKFRWWMEGQGRFGNDASQFSQSLVRPGVGYAITDKLIAWIGYAWAPTAEPLALKAGHPYNEHRLWEQITWADNFSFGRLALRSRFEQRFFDHHAPMPGSNDVAHRFRQMVKWNIPLNQINPNLSFVVQDELFIAMTTVSNPGFITNGFDQNRGFVGLAYKFNQMATAEVGYMNQYINRPHSARPDQMMHNAVVNLFLNF